MMLMNLFTTTVLILRHSGAQAQKSITSKTTASPIRLGSPCVSNPQCMNVPNSHCLKKTCECLPDFFEHKAAPGVCRLAPGYDEACATGGLADSYPRCRHPFVCNSTNTCDCPQGFIQDFFQCIRDCASDQVPTFDGCLDAAHLGENCTTDEQCVQSYAACLHGICQCIPGANQLSGSCYPVNQCPLGDPARDADGSITPCNQHGLLDCPKDHYCMFPQMSTTGEGFCCPKIRMNCPIGRPLDGHNCTNCPWHTHHCFSYVIGTFTETMCCPNACPTTQPILVSGQCYAQVAFSGRCLRDEQCSAVQEAICRLDVADGLNKCLCPSQTHINRFGKCIKQSVLGGNCTSDDECKTGTNTICGRSLVCECYNGYMPEPKHTPSMLAQKCIAEPSCPTSKGVKPVSGDYQDCSKNSDVCIKSEFCRKWWFDGNRTYALCCPKPSLSDYQDICTPFGMRLILHNEIADEETARSLTPDFQDAEPLRCAISVFNVNTTPSPVVHDTPVHTAADHFACPFGASCLYDPFSPDNSGVCCRSPEVARPDRVRPTITDTTANQLLPSAIDPKQSTNQDTIPNKQAKPVIPAEATVDPKSNKIVEQPMERPRMAPAGLVVHSRLRSKSPHLRRL